MLLKKLFFLALPIIVVYWRSRAAQNATQWLFRGVLPKDGPWGQVFSEISNRTQANRSQPEQPVQTMYSQPIKVVKRKPRSVAATVASHWPVVLAFLAGVCLAGWLFSISSSKN
jgi:hypothetical protein